MSLPASPSRINEALAEGYASLEKEEHFRTHNTLDDVFWSVTCSSPGDSIDALMSMPSPGTYRYTLSSSAHADLCAIWEVAKTRETPAAAKRLIRELVRDIGTFVQTPTFGRVRPELLGLPHCYPDRWAIYYHPTVRPEGIAVVRVLDGRSIPEDQPRHGKSSPNGGFQNAAPRRPDSSLKASLIQKCGSSRAI